MSKVKRAAAVAAACGFLLASTSMSASAWDGRVNGRTTAYSSYRYATSASTNAHTGYDFYFGAANGTVSGGIMVRWVKCGETSTQDGASSAGGPGYRITGSPIGMVIGSSFKSGACVKAWTRSLTYAGSGQSFGYEQYFNNSQIA